MARVAEAVGRTLAACGVEVCFGVLGSGNLTYTNAFRHAGGTFVASAIEGGAVCMADGYGRVSGKVAAVSVHQGPGLTNTVTGLAEAAKSRTPLVLVAADTPGSALRSNFRIAQDDLVTSVGAAVERVHGGATAVADVARAVRRARSERRAVVLMVPLDVQAQEADEAAGPPVALLGAPLAPPHPAPGALAQVAELLRTSERPLIVGGRGAVLSGAGPALRALAERTGALLATSAVAHGLFAGDPFDLGISGGFSSPLAASLIAESDVVLAFGAALNQWTTRHGALLGDDTRLVQVDLDVDAIGAHRPVAAGVLADARATAEALLEVLPGPDRTGRRTDAQARELATSVRWRDVPIPDPSPAGLDPRTFSRALDDVLPRERTVVVDSGHFSGWPSMYLEVPDATGFVFPQAFQCVGLALGNAIGAAVARPDRLTVCAIGDGGLLMSLPELATLARLRPRMVVVVYNDRAYGAEVHHFRPMGQAVDLAQFPDTDFAALARAAGCEGVTVTREDDLGAVAEWLASGEDARPLVIDAKIDPDICAEWLEEAFRGH